MMQQRGAEAYLVAQRLVKRFDEALASLQLRAQALLAELGPDLPKANRRQGQRKDVV